MNTNLKKRDIYVVLSIRSMFPLRICFFIIYRMSEAIFDNNGTDDSAVNYQIRQKWGNAIGKGGLTGYLALPEVLVRGQHRLGLNSTEMMVLINILLHWWHAEKMPFPSNQKIAKRMGVDPRTVQRACKTLEDKKLIHREVTIFHDDQTNAYHSHRTINLGRLVARLNEIAVDLGKYANQTRLSGTVSEKL